jgi:hypothetical protein
MRMPASLLVLVSSPALSHPGHGALAVHWHLDDLAWALLGALAVLGVTWLVVKRWKR